MTYKIPEDLEADQKEWPRIVGWPVAIRTAVDALFNCMGFGLPGLGGGKWVLDGEDPRGRALLIVIFPLSKLPSWGALVVIRLTPVHPVGSLELRRSRSPPNRPRRRLLPDLRHGVGAQPRRPDRPRRHSLLRPPVALRGLRDPGRGAGVRETAFGRL